MVAVMPECRECDVRRVMREGLCVGGANSLLFWTRH